MDDDMDCVFEVALEVVDEFIVISLYHTGVHDNIYLGFWNSHCG